MHILSGPARVVEHGMVTTFEGHPLRLALPDGVVVDLRFRADPTRPDVDVQSDVVDGALVLTLFNFDGPDGRGSGWPVLVAERLEDLLYLHFRVFLFGRTQDRTVHFTFYSVPRSAAPA